MVYRKNWFDYLLLTVYTGICVMILAYMGNQIYVTYVGAPLAKLGMFLTFPVLLCLYPAIRHSSLTIRKKHSFSAHSLAMAEAFAVSVSFVFGTLIRIKEARIWAYIYEVGSSMEEGLEKGIEAGYYYDMAVVKIGEGSGPLSHGMSDLYVRCLRLVFSFLGNSVSAAILFQIALQLFAMLFAYLAVKKAAGRFAACTVLLLLAFSGPFIRRIDAVSPECLFLALFLAGLYLTVSFVKGSLRREGILSSLPGAVLTGVLLGVLCYLDLYCAILLLFLSGLLTGKADVAVGRKSLVGRLFLSLTGCITGFAGAAAIDVIVSGISFYREITVWLEPYRYPELLDMRVKHVSVIGIDYLFFVFLFLLASFVILSFLRGGKEQSFSIWFLPCILVTPFFLLDFSVVGAGGLTLFFWYSTAALGLRSVVLDGQAELMQEKIEKINAAAEAGPAAAEPAADASAQKPRFLENPLPVPQKHVKKEIDFDYPVAPDKMHYDLELTDGDDFAL